MSTASRGTPGCRMVLHPHFGSLQQNTDPDVPLTSSSFLSVQFRIVSMDIDFIPVNRVVSVCVFTGWFRRARVSAEVYFGSGEWEGERRGCLLVFEGTAWAGSSGRRGVTNTPAEFALARTL